MLPDEEKATLPENINVLEIFVNRAFETNGSGTTSTCSKLSIAGCPLPDEKWGKLIARIGLEIPFSIGNQSIFKAPSSGILYLRMNDTDSDLLDNSGVLAVLVEVERP